MAELIKQDHYFVAVKDGEPVGGVYRDEEYCYQVLWAAYTRDNPNIEFFTDEDIEEAVRKAGYEVKHCTITILED